MGWHMNPFGEELAAFAVLHQLFGVGYHGRPVKPYMESLSDQHLGGCMVPTGSGMYVFEQFYTIVLDDAFHQYLGTCVFAHESTIDE
jgi:hypothetical protein